MFSAGNWIDEHGTPSMEQTLIFQTIFLFFLWGGGGHQQDMQNTDPLASTSFYTQHQEFGGQFALTLILRLGSVVGARC